MEQYTVEFANRGQLWSAPSHYSIHGGTGVGFNPLLNRPVTPDVWSVGANISTLTVSKDVLIDAIWAYEDLTSHTGVFHISLHTGVPSAANELTEAGYQREPLRASSWNAR